MLSILRSLQMTVEGHFAAITDAYKGGTTTQKFHESRHLWDGQQAHKSQRSYI